MRTSVRLFAVARQIAGCDRVELELPEHATIGDLRQQLGRDIPALSGLLGPMLFALDARYVNDASLVPPNAEIACIPPVSGG
ncbi:MAG: MoaD/ThiS family protein [Pirellulales bacterium]|nr:MoaD/ThiS family protein [Pirellulales bacterium]